jgi:hypothetical protein
VSDRVAFGTAGGGEQHPETAVGMTDEVSTVTHDLGDVLGVTQEVLALHHWAPSVATPVEHEQAKTLIGERSLGLPLLRARGQRAVHEHNRCAGAPYVNEEVAHAWFVPSCNGSSGP